MVRNYIKRNMQQYTRDETTVILEILILRKIEIMEMCGWSNGRLVAGISRGKGGCTLIKMMQTSISFRASSVEPS